MQNDQKHRGNIELARCLGLDKNNNNKEGTILSSMAFIGVYLATHNLGVFK